MVIYATSQNERRLIRVGFMSVTVGLEDAEALMHKFADLIAASSECSRIPVSPALGGDASALWQGRTCVLPCELIDGKTIVSAHGTHNLEMPCGVCLAYAEDEAGALAGFFRGIAHDVPEPKSGLWWHRHYRDHVKGWTKNQSDLVVYLECE